MRRAICLISLGIASLLVVPGTAAASGGASIASAPAVTYGQPEFGNLAYGGVKPEDCGVEAYRSWWTLPVTVGDSVQVDWEVQSSEVMVNLFAPGTTDFNFPTTNPLVQSTVNNNLKAELTYQATVSGILPLEFFANFYGCGTTAAPGPYSFTAYVKHEVRLFIPHRRVLPLHGTVAVHVSTPEGQPISDPGLQVLVQIQSHGHWRVIGSAAAAGGVDNVPCTVPTGLRGSHTLLRAIARGNAYEPATSTTVRVRVA